MTKRRTRRWIDVSTASELIGVSKRTIQRWCHEGRIHAKRFGLRRWMIDVKKIVTTRYHSGKFDFFGI